MPIEMNSPSTEVVYCLLAEPPVTIEVALEWKEDRHLPWLQELRQIAQEVKMRKEFK